MKDAHFAKQKNRNPAARPFFNFGAQFDKKRLHIAPLDIAARWPRKDQLNNSLVPLLHCLNSTISKYRKQETCQWSCNDDLKYLKALQLRRYVRNQLLNK